MDTVSIVEIIAIYFMPALAFVLVIVAAKLAIPSFIFMHRLHTHNPSIKLEDNPFGLTTQELAKCRREAEIEVNLLD